MPKKSKKPKSKKPKSKKNKKSKKPKSKKTVSKNYPYNIVYIQDRKDCQKIYCGKSRKLPSGYTKMGERFDCLKKGFGAGKSTGEGKLIVKVGDLSNLDLRGLKFIARSLKIKKVVLLTKKQLISKIINKSHVC